MALDSPSHSLLKSLLVNNEYSLALSPGFFRFYALIGIIHALDEANCLNVTHVSGASAGALVGGFLASGMKPCDMIEKVLEIRREDIWDMVGIGGLLKGQLFQQLLERHLPVKNMEDCPIPVGVTVWDVLKFRTKIITSGNLATAMRASCTFPLLFQPVVIDNSICIDGGVFDHSGLMALPGVPKSNFIVNIACDEATIATNLEKQFPLCNVSNIDIRFSFCVILRIKLAY